MTAPTTIPGGSVSTARTYGSRPMAPPTIDGCRTKLTASVPTIMTARMPSRSDQRARLKSIHHTRIATHDAADPMMATSAPPSWSTSGATSLVRLLRNNVLVLDNAALTGSAQDCLPFAGNYTYRLVASTSGGQSTSRDQSVLVTEAPPANPLPGNTFDLTMLNGQPLIPETVITITFNSDGTLNGSAGCNNYNGRYTANNGQITISELSLTTMQCGIPPSVMDQELAYTNALRAAATFDFQQQNGLLIMHNAVGQEILRYVIKIEPLAVQLAGES